MSFISFFSKRYTYINFKYQSFYSMYKVLNRWQVNLRLFDHQLKEVSKLFVNLAVIVSNSSKTKKPPSMNLLLQALGIVNVGILYAKDSSHLLWFVTQFEFREYLQLSQLIRILTVAIDYLNEPANGVHRVGAIAIVSLTVLPYLLIHIWNCPAWGPNFCLKIFYEFSFAFQRVQYLVT